MRWGVLSTAWINDELIPALRESPRADLRALASRDGLRAAQYAAVHDIPVAHGSYEALLEDDTIEAVYIPLPNSMHVEWSIRALEAGKHVLCEKPLDVRVAEVERAFDAAEHAGRLLMEAFMWRHHPATIAMDELVSGGAIGELRHLRSSFTVPFRERGENIRLQPELLGGALLDIGCYPVSAVRLFAGEPETVMARHRLGPTGVDAHISAMLCFAGDVVGFIEGGFDLPARSVIEVVGTSGTLTAWWPFFPRFEPRIEVRAEGGAVKTLVVADVNRYRCQVDNFSKAIRGEATPLLGRDDAVGQARVLEALRRSAVELGQITAV